MCLNSLIPLIIQNFLMDKGILIGLKLDRWYKVFVYAGLFLFILSLFLPIKGITNGELQLLSGGVFFIGTGEWISWKVANHFKPPNIYTGTAGILSYPIRQHTFLGWFFIILGLLLAILFVLKLLKVI